ncbi:MAG: hypothetical protein JOZ00_26755 [Mycobacterium sp.]|uniref:hypothetical protein n=1 Tax=Mycobacterium sp. TaxID=1785 RepID=UPI001EC12ABB|nr:hypothetical protein [Mycobacterium sp.]MBV8790266.1 hypothetical protein [Mycobacterium sp.]
MEAKQAKSHFLEELEEFKAKHGEDAAGLRIVRFVDHDGNEITEVVAGSSYECHTLPDGNVECSPSRRQV